MTVDKLSEKQKTVLKWAHLPRYADYNAIICDGAVRSGKTVAMIIGFVHWAMKNFKNSSFSICGKTMAAVERNIIVPMQSMDDITAFYDINYNSTKGIVNISSGGCENRFYIFGGKDEQSYMMIQGMTLCGVLFDEVALMPKSFVEQAIARTLSEKDAKLWFNCNPDSPEHWFYKEWILDADGENIKHSLHIHFDMDDNPILDDEAKNKAKNMYEGVFRRRFIDGEWVQSSGVIYSVFDDEAMVADCSDIPAKECYLR